MDAAQRIELLLTEINNRLDRIEARQRQQRDDEIVAHMAMLHEWPSPSQSLH